MHALTRETQSVANSELIGYGTSLHSLDAAALEREYRALLAATASARSSVGTIKLALLLGTPSATFGDINSALRLLSDAVAAGGEGSEFAQFAYDMLSARTCVDAEDGALAELLLLERERGERLATDLDATRAALDAERTLRQTLQGQLDALKLLEERLNGDGLQQR